MNGYLAKAGVAAPLAAYTADVVGFFEKWNPVLEGATFIVAMLAGLGSLYYYVKQGRK